MLSDLLQGQIMPITICGSGPPPDKGHFKMKEAIKEGSRGDPHHQNHGGERTQPAQAAVLCARQTRRMSNTLCICSKTLYKQRLL